MNIRGKILLCMLLIFAVFFFGHTEEAYGQSQQIENMSATVGVNAVFGMNIFPTELVFTSADPGTTTEIKELTLWCSSNNNQPWSIQLSDLSELTSGSFTIPNDNFNWWGWSEGSGIWNEGTTNMSTTPFTFYQCSQGEYITDSAVVVHLSFNVDIPANQVAGEYASVLVVTITE